MTNFMSFLMCLKEQSEQTFKVIGAIVCAMYIANLFGYTANNVFSTESYPILVIGLFIGRVIHAYFIENK